MRPDTEDRAVSPVIGVILMVAITVILAAVIAAFVLDMGDSVGQEAQAGVNIEVDENNQYVDVSVTSIGNSDRVHLRGAIPTDNDNFEGDTDLDEDSLKDLGVGDTVRIGADEFQTDSTASSSDTEFSGTITAVAVIDSDGTETRVASEDYDFEYEEADFS